MNTEPGTFRVKDIHPGPRPSIPGSFRILNGQLLFSANDGTNGGELWTSDGTEAGTVLLKDINPTGASSPMQPVIAGNQMFFSANNGTHGAELWLTDGTEPGTRLVKDIRPGATGSSISQLLPMDDYVLFKADDDVHGAFSRA